jgi:hypothetical protein
MKPTVERIRQGGMLLVSAIINGRFVCRRYMGYTKREAVRMFKAEVKG